MVLYKGLSRCLLLCLLLGTGGAWGQCPWHRDAKDLQSACLCAYNLGKELSVQCDMVDWQRLMAALNKHAASTVIDLLYVNNSTVGRLEAGAVDGLRLRSVQLSGCRISQVAVTAFRGQEATLRNLNLQDNELTEVPVEALRPLRSLVLLDLSRNRISRVPDSAFETLRGLTTLKLADNNATLSPGAFRGLDGSLKNLNLKGTRQRTVPSAVRTLHSLAFLDLAQNGLRELPARALVGLDSLAALNLERNLIQMVGPEAFAGVSGTLSSLSLLNNLLTDFPTAAIASLTELRVLDIGFNLLTELPRDAFRGTQSLTLLALDGNPLTSVPEVALAHLNTTLRGLSLGGRFLHCDCRLCWLTEWIRRGDLQVTSRERSPQFCGSPESLKDRTFYSIQPVELTCPNDITTTSSTSTYTTTTSTTTRRPAYIENYDEMTPVPEIGVGVSDMAVSRPPPTKVPLLPFVTPHPTTTATTTTTTTTTTTPAPPPPPPTTPRIIETTSQEIPTTIQPTIPPPTQTTAAITTTRRSVRPVVPTQRRPGSNGPAAQPPSPPLVPWRSPNRPALVSASNGYSGKGQVAPLAHDVIVRSAYRQDNAVIIQWDSETANILGFRVVYRLFGDKTFKQGPPLEASEREFKIKNVPSQECIVVCVISLEEVQVSPETVPWTQCREVRTVPAPTSNMDKITIAASAAICATVVIAVVVFVAASRRRTRSLHSTKPCCAAALSTPSPGAQHPLSSLATLSAFTSHKDWDAASCYSNRSIPRPRVFHVDRQGGSITGGLGTLGALSSLTDAQQMGSTSKPSLVGGHTTRSIADGQSTHSFSQHSGRYLAGSGLVSTRPELRQSRQSLASRASYTPSHHHHAPSVHGSGASPRRQRTRSRPPSRYSHGGSTHTLNNYCDTSDNWTDHDMDIYMARNPTTRGGLVPL